MTKSEIFTQYNKARKAAREGKLDLARVNRALGVAQLKLARPYATTIKSCTCPDYLKTNKPCKHMIAKMIEAKVSKKVAPAPAPVPAPKVAPKVEWSGGIWMRGNDGSYMTCESKMGRYNQHYFTTLEELQEWARGGFHGTLVHPARSGRKGIVIWH